MSDEQLKGIADDADMVVNGYAFTADDSGNVRVVNLRPPHHAALFDANQQMLETSMDDIELDIVRDYLIRNQDFLAA